MSSGMRKGAISKFGARINLCLVSRPVLRFLVTALRSPLASRLVTFHALRMFIPQTCGFLAGIVRKPSHQPRLFLPLRLGKCRLGRAVIGLGECGLRQGRIGRDANAQFVVISE